MLAMSRFSARVLNGNNRPRNGNFCGQCRGVYGTLSVLTLFECKFLGILTTVGKERIALHQMRHSK